MEAENIKVLKCDLWIRGTEEGINGKITYKYRGLAKSFEFHGEEILAKINGHEVNSEKERPWFYSLDIKNPDKLVSAADKKISPLPLQIRKSLEFEEEDNVLEIEFITNAKESSSGLIKKELGDDKYLIYTAPEIVLLSQVFPCLSSKTVRIPYEATFVLPKEWDVVFSGHNKDKLDYSAPSLAEWVSPELEDWLDEELQENFEYAAVYHYKVLQQEACPYSLFFCFGDLQEIDLNIWAVNKKCEKSIPIIQEIKFKTLEWIKNFLDMPISGNKLKVVILPGLECTIRNFYSVCLLGEKELVDSIDDRSSLVLSMANRIAHQLFGHCVTVKGLVDMLLVEGICHYLAQQFYESTKKAFSFPLISANLMKISARTNCLKKDIVLSAMADEEIENSLVVKCLVERCAIAVNMLGVGLGHPELLDLLREIVHRYKWKSIQRKTFHQHILDRCALMENGSRKDFATRWWDDWLESTGVNTLSLEIKPNGIIVTQSMTQGTGDRLKMHFLTLMFLDKEGHLIGTKTFTIKAVAQCRLVHNWLKVTAAIVPNSDGNTYARILMDTDSFIYLRENMNKVMFKTPRIMAYQSFFDHVQCLSMHPKQFCKLVITHYDSLFSQEYQDKIVHDFFWPTFTKYLKPEHHKQVSHNFFQLCLSLMAKKRLQGLMSTFMIRCCIAKANIAKLIELLDMFDDNTKGKKEFFTLVVLKINTNAAIEDDLKQSIYDKYADQYETEDPEAVASLNDMLGFSVMTPAEKRIALYDSLQKKIESKRTGVQQDRSNLANLYLETLKVLPEFLENDQVEEFIKYIKISFLSHFELLHRYLKDLMFPVLGNHSDRIIKELNNLKQQELYDDWPRNLKLTLNMVISDLELASKWQNLKTTDPHNVFGEVSPIPDLLVGQE